MIADRSETEFVAIKSARSPKAISSVRTSFSPIRDPIIFASFQGTPMTHAKGLNIQPRICCRLRSNKPKIAFTIAIIATNAISIAATFAASFIPLVAPLERASIMLSSLFSSEIFKSPRVSDISVSG